MHAKTVAWQPALGRRAVDRFEKDGDQEWSPYNSGAFTKYSPSYPLAAPSDNYPADRTPPEIPPGLKAAR
jgi:hypothetical protein